MILWQSPRVEIGVCWPHNGDYPDPGRISMIKRASAGRRVLATARAVDSVPPAGSSPRCERWVCQVPPSQLTSGAAKGGEHRHRRHLGANSVLVLIIFVMAMEPFAATRAAFDQREGVRVATDEAGPVRCGPGRVVVPSVRVSTEGRASSSPRSRWAASRYRRSWAGRSFSGVLVTARVSATTSCPWSSIFCMSCASAGQSPCRRSRGSTWPASDAHRCSGRN
jgi:hypothetical protein